MMSDKTARATESAAVVRWSTPIPQGRVHILPVSDGGCLLCSDTTMTMYASRGEPRWQVPASVPTLEAPILGPDGSILSTERDAITVRSVDTGDVLRAIPADRGTNLSMTPWGDLLYLDAEPGCSVVARCVGMNGQPRWSVPVEGSEVLGYGFSAVGDVVVFAQRGALWTFDRSGATPWIADSTGVHAPEVMDRARPGSGDLGSTGVRISAPPCSVAADRMLFELEDLTHHGWYLLDTTAPSLTPLAVPSPLRHPYIVTTRSSIVGFARPVEVDRSKYAFAVEEIAWDMSPRWRRLLPAQPRTLTALPDGGTIAAASPTPKYWADYHKFYDLRAHTFVHALERDGTTRWAWHPPGPLTHPPIAASDGTVYVCADDQLWALSPTPERLGSMTDDNMPEAQQQLRNAAIHILDVAANGTPSEPLTRALQSLALAVRGEVPQPQATHDAPVLDPSRHLLSGLHYNGTIGTPITLQQMAADWRRQLDNDRGLDDQEPDQPATGVRLTELRALIIGNVLLELAARLTPGAAFGPSSNGSDLARLVTDLSDELFDQTFIGRQ